jgi:hypothetical protein
VRPFDDDHCDKTIEALHPHSHSGRYTDDLPEGPESVHQMMERDLSPETFDPMVADAFTDMFKQTVLKNVRKQ